MSNMFNNELLEKWASTLPAKSRKVSKSYAKKLVNVAMANPEIDNTSELVEIAKAEDLKANPEKPFKSWFQVLKQGSALKRFAEVQTIEKEFEKIEISVENTEGRTVAELQEALRQQQAAAQISAKELQENQAAEKAAAEKLAEAKKAAQIAEAKRLADLAAEKENGCYPKGRLVEIIQKEADISEKPLSPAIQKPSIDVNSYIPQESKYYWMENERAMICSLIKNNLNCLVHGGAGLGKSSMFQQFAFEEKIPIVRYQCNSEAIPDDLLYSKTMDKGTVEFFAQGFLQACELANQKGIAFLIFEELNLFPQSVMTSAHSMLDDIKEQMSQIGKVALRKGCKVFIAATANLGYAGTEELTPALESRFFFYKKQEATKEFVFSNIWTEKVSLDVKQKFWNVVKAIEKADVSKNHVFNIREPKNCLKIWDTMPKDLILDNIASRWSDNPEEYEIVKNIVKREFN